VGRPGSKACGSPPALGLHLRFRGFVSLDNRRVATLERLLAEFRPSWSTRDRSHALSYASLTGEGSGGRGRLTGRRDDCLLPEADCFHGGEERGGFAPRLRRLLAEVLPAASALESWATGGSGACSHATSTVSSRSPTSSHVIRENAPSRQDDPHAMRSKVRCPRGRDQDFRRRFRLEGKQVLTIAGRLTSRKGWASSPRAPRASHRRSPICACCDGPHRDREAVRPGARELGVADRVVTTGGRREDLQARTLRRTSSYPSICFDTFGSSTWNDGAQEAVVPDFGGSPRSLPRGERLRGNPFDIEAFRGRIRGPFGATRGSGSDGRGWVFALAQRFYDRPAGRSPRGIRACVEAPDRSTRGSAVDSPN